MKNLLIAASIFAMVFAVDGANAAVTKGDIQRNDYDFFKLDGTTITATGDEINHAADVSERVVLSTATSDAVTLAEHEGRIILLNNTAGNQTLTLPNNDAASYAVYTFCAGSAAEGGTTTIAVATNDNATMAGDILAWNETTSLIYSSAATLGGSDTIKLSSANTDRGDCIQVTSTENDLWLVEGQIRFESIGQDTVLFSSAVPHVD